MRQMIKEKLNQINELYPEERINASKKRIQDIWAGKIPEDRYPYTFMPINFNYYDDIHTAEERLVATLDEAILRAQFEDDYIPSVFPGCKQSTIPTMFGAKAIVCGKDHVSERIIANADDIKKLAEPQILKESEANEFLEMQKYCFEETEGQMLVHVTDMQGPGDVCGQLMGYDNLFLMAYTDEEQFRKIMSMATKAFIMLWSEQQKILKNAFLGTHLFGWSYIPQGIGATVSADSMVMVSPDFFNEFYLPYLNEISRSFGGLVIHSCGNFSHLLKNLYKIEGIKGINAGQMSVEEMMDAGLDDRLVAIAITNMNKAEQMFCLARNYGIRMDLTITGAWPGEDYYPLPMSKWSQNDFDKAKKANDYLKKVSIVR